MTFLAVLLMHLTCVKVNLVSSATAMASAVAAATAPDPSTANTAIWIGIGSLVSAAGGVLTACLKMMFDDRKDRRATELAARTHDQRVIDMANKLNRQGSRLEALEGVEEAARDLKRRYEDLEDRYEREVNGELRPGIKVNAAGLSAVLEGWGSKYPPSQPDPSDPLPRPEFDPLPAEPNPVATRASQDDFPIPPALRTDPPPPPEARR